MASQIPLAVGLDDHARFSTYFAGPNEIVVRHLEQLGGARQSVTWLWGPAASGKTHLLQAACAQAGEGGHESVFVPLTGVEAVQPGILDGLAAPQLVCLDDLQAVVGDPAWEQALFRLFNGLVEKTGTLLVSATASPQELPFSLADLRSRMSWGPTFRLQALTDAERIEALRLRAERRGLELSEEVGQWLLKRVPRDMNSLYQLLDTLDAESLAAGRRLTVPFVRGILEKRRASG